MYKGRIIVQRKTFDVIPLIDVTNDQSNLSENIPTLIIGKKFAESIYGADNVKVLDRKINENVYWAYSKTENRDDFTKSISSFEELILSRIKNDVKYSYFNIFIEKLSKIKKFIAFINGEFEKYIFIRKNCLYIFYNNNVIGISLNDLQFIGVSVEKVYKVLYRNKYNHIIKNSEFISDSLKKYVYNNNIVIPYIYFLLNN